jgi:hypothetical protein
MLKRARPTIVIRPEALHALKQYATAQCPISATRASGETAEAQMPTA